MHIPLTIVQQANVINAINAFWTYYYGAECTAKRADIERALAGALRDYPIETICIVLDGSVNVEICAFLAAHLHPKPSIFLLNCGIVDRAKVKR